MRGFIKYSKLRGLESVREDSRGSKYKRGKEGKRGKEAQRGKEGRREKKI